MYCYVQEFDKIIGTHVKFKESLFNMELVLLWPYVQLQFVWTIG